MTGDSRSQPRIASVLRDLHDDILGHAYDRSVFLTAADRIEELEAALNLARAFIDPNIDPPRMSNQDLLTQIDAALQSEKTP